MIDFLVQLDIWMLLRLNAGAANPFFDWLMPIATELRNWWPLIIGGLIAIAIWGGGKGRVAVLIAIVLLTLTDQLASTVIKNLIERPRPCHEVDGLRVLYRCGKTFSFPSSHAMTSMAAAIFFGLMFRRLLWLLIAASVLVSYSRVYIGVHYPFDLLAGWVLGGGLAVLAVWVYHRWAQPYMNGFRLFRDNGIEAGST